MSCFVYGRPTFVNHAVAKTEAWFARPEDIVSTLNERKRSFSMSGMKSAGVSYCLQPFPSHGSVVELRPVITPTSNEMFVNGCVVVIGTDAPFATLSEAPVERM